MIQQCYYVVYTWKKIIETKSKLFKKFRLYEIVIKIVI